MDGVEIINVTPYGNIFTKICVGTLILWGGSIAFRRKFFSSPIEEHSRNKRYMINSQTKLNNDIKHRNRNNSGVPVIPNFFGRHKRFNKFR